MQDKWPFKLSGGSEDRVENDRIDCSIVRL